MTTRHGLAVVGTAAAALAACGAAGVSAPLSAAPAGPSAPPHSPPPPGAPTATAAVSLGPQPAQATPTPPPTLAAVHYIVPPGWTIARATATDVDLTTESGLAIELSLVDGSPSALTAASGRPFAVGGETGYEADGPSGVGYRDRIDVRHAPHVYEVSCTSPQAGDRETTVDICEGFADGMTWS